MYLSSISLHGFKSFADKTAVHFDPGVTAIVGPNGCGKSNIIDAVRWVLGEQRARLLRSEKMENIIFNGTSTRRALGLAEVSLSIENTRNVLPTEYTDVTIGRRLYRSGESEYLLNGTVCRLKDILDLFMDTGMGAGAYSVIELKMIEDILSENAEDRRRLFEEAAGITKYKKRRHQALRRLDTTQSDLTRLADLIAEIEKNVRSLSRQAKKAQRHERLRSRLRELELHLAAADYHRLNTERRALDTDADTLNDELTERTAKLQAAEAEGESLRAALLDREREAAEAQRALNAHVEQIRAATAEARLAEERQTAAEAALDRLDRERTADAERRAALEEERASLAGRIADAEAALEDAEAVQAERATARDEADAEADAARARATEANAAARRTADAVADARAALDAARNRLDLLDAERSRADAALDALRQNLADAEEQAASAEERRAAAETERETAEDALREAEAELDRLDAALDENAEALRAARQRRDAANAETALLQSLLDSYEGFSDAVQTLLTEPDWADAPRTVADVLACDARYRPAVDAALGAFASCLVVQSEAEAEAGIARLRAEEAGRATFVVLDRLPDEFHPAPSETPAGTTPVADVVRTDAPYRPLAHVLLQNHFLIDSLDEAEVLREQHPAARFVTPEGEWTSARGIVHAGGEEKTASAERLGRREQLDAAAEAAETAEAEVERLEAEEGSLRAERQALALDQKRIALREAERAFAAVERETAQADAERRSLLARRDELQSRRDELDAELDAATATDALETALDEARTAHEQAGEARDAAEAESDAAEADRRAARDRYNEAHLHAVQARNRLDALRRDRERAAASLRELDERAEARDAEAERVRAEREEAAGRKATQEGRAERLRETKTELDDAVRHAETTVSDARSAISDTDARVRTVRREREKAQEQRSAGAVRLTEIGTRMEAVSERVWDEYGIALGEIDEPGDDFDPDAARREIPGLRDKLRSLGAVNELAREAYEEEKERLDFLQGQQADLEEAEASLRSTIREINTTASERFDETFQAVRREFKRLFQHLFGGDASADILLTGDDPLEDDIEIRARPKGKKPSAITQLSGGEKTLTAIALLFAIYLVKPSPFCILDEVDAPLDDANVERFMSLIRSFAETTQFILVTHNKLTMEAADRMYGVTMQEQGVSKLVGVSFDEVLEAA